MESFSGEKTEALRLLEGFEEGNLPIADLPAIAMELDPLLVYFVLRFVREKYPAGRPTSEGIVARLIEVTANYPDIVKIAKKGEEDSLVEWFDDAYELRDYFNNPQEFIDLIHEKMES